MFQEVSLARFIFDSELKVIGHWQVGRFKTHYQLEKTTSYEVCPRCATKSTSVHDRQWVEVQDAPIRGVGI